MASTPDYRHVSKSTNQKMMVTDAIFYVLYIWTKQALSYYVAEGFCPYRGSLPLSSRPDHKI
jgi:hypothetical protein